MDNESQDLNDLNDLIQNFNTSEKLAQCAVISNHISLHWLRN